MDENNIPKPPSEPFSLRHVRGYITEQIAYYEKEIEELKVIKKKLGGLSIKLTKTICKKQALVDKLKVESKELEEADKIKGTIPIKIRDWRIDRRNRNVYRLRNEENALSQISKDTSISKRKRRRNAKRAARLTIRIQAMNTKTGKIAKRQAIFVDKRYNHRLRTVKFAADILGRRKGRTVYKRAQIKEVTSQINDIKNECEFFEQENSGKIIVIGVNRFISNAKIDTLKARIWMLRKMKGYLFDLQRSFHDGKINANARLSM